MRKLPHWVLTDKFPAFYDCESLSAIEQTARLYRAMQELIEEYNKFVDDVNKHVDEFENSSNENYSEFTIGLRQEFQDFIDTVELALGNQEREIDEFINYVKANMSEKIQSILNDMIENNEFNELVLNVFEEVKENLETISTALENVNSDLKTLAEFKTKTEDDVEALNKSLEENVEALNKSLEENVEALNKSLEDFKTEQENTIADEKKSLGSILDGLRSKILAITSTIRILWKDKENLISERGTRISSFIEGSYINFMIGNSDCSIRLNLDNNVAEYLTIDRINAYNILPSHVFSHYTLANSTKTISKIVLDNKVYEGTDIIKNLYIKDLKFKVLVISIDANTTTAGSMKTTILIDNNGFVVFETYNDDYIGEKKTGLVMSTNAQHVITHGSTEKLFFNSVSEKNRRYLRASVKNEGNTSVKTFDIKGVY